MLQKSLKLVGLVVVLVLVGSWVSWAAYAQQGVSFDPGQMVTDEATRQALIAEALPEIVKAGYDSKEFDFEKAVADPEGKAIFLPVKVTSKVRQRIQEFRQNELWYLLVGLLYIREPLEFNGRTYPKGLHPVVLQNSAVSSSSLPANGTAGPVAAPTLAAQPSAGDSGGGGGPIVLDPPSPSPPPGGGGGRCSGLAGFTLGAAIVGQEEFAVAGLLLGLLIGCVGPSGP